MTPAAGVTLAHSPSTTDNVHYTVLVRLPFPRGDFVDPPAVTQLCCLSSATSTDDRQVTWDSSKDHELWDILSKASTKGTDLDCERRMIYML